MARRTNRSTSKPNSCAESARACRARPRRMSPYACDYGAGGAALFDIVNVQIWTRRRVSGAPTRSLPHRERRRDPFVNFPRAGLAHRAEHSPRKREAGGSSPPASTSLDPGRNRPVAGHRFGKAETGVRSAVAAPSIRLGKHSWRNGRRSRLRSGRRKAWRFKSSRVHQFVCAQRHTTARRSLRQAAKASVLHTDIPRFESWSEHHTASLA